MLRFGQALKLTEFKPSTHIKDVNGIMNGINFYVLFAAVIKLFWRNILRKSQ